MKRLFGLLIVFLLLMIIPAAAFGEELKVRLALISFENMDDNDQHNYLGGLISAILREDLSTAEGISLLDRRSITSVLDEQRLQISGLFDESEAVEAGKLLGSDYLVGGSFIVIGTEVLLDLTLIDVETAEVISFSSRGDTEDIIHTAAEKISRKLTGSRTLFRTADSAVPILRQELLPPGKLKLFSPLSRARIILDDEFYGYTTGSSAKPVEIELQPGLHTVEIDLGREFGIVIEPEIIFKHWQKDFKIVSEKEVVLEDPTAHYNTLTSRIRFIMRDSHTFYLPDSEEYNNQWSFSFRDREGQPVEGSLTLHMMPDNNGSATAEALIIYNDQRLVYELECLKDEKLDFEETIGIIKFEMDLSAKYPGRVSASWALNRIDVYHNMYNE